MATKTNELNVWHEDAPVVNINPNLEFDVWHEDVPVLEVDETYSQQVPQVRRRVFIF